jgi:hypothetical protein
VSSSLTRMSTILNVFWGLDWVGLPTHVRYGRDVPDSDFLISCVDTRAARSTLARIARLKTRRFYYWLDVGNSASTGQFVLGESLRPNRKGTSTRLPCVDELFPHRQCETRCKGFSACLQRGGVPSPAGAVHQHDARPACAGIACATLSIG